jgi:hypothetical protein
MFPLAAFGETVVLSIESECDVQANRVTCKPSTKTAEIYFKDGTWYGIKDETTKDAVPLGVLRNDQYILVLSNPVLFSGTSIVHIMKANDRFYWNEVAYSEALKADENHVRIGRVKRK